MLVKGALVHARGVCALESSSSCFEMSKNIQLKQLSSWENFLDYVQWLFSWGAASFQRLHNNSSHHNSNCFNTASNMEEPVSTLRQDPNSLSHGIINTEVVIPNELNTQCGRSHSVPHHSLAISLSDPEAPSSCQV